MSLHEINQVLNTARSLIISARLEEGILLLTNILSSPMLTEDGRDEVLTQIIRAHIDRGETEKAVFFHGKMQWPQRIDINSLLISRFEQEGRISRAQRIKRNNKIDAWLGYSRLCSERFVYSKQVDGMRKATNSTSSRSISIRRHHWPSNTGAVLDKARVIGNDWAVYNSEAGGFLFSTFHHHDRIPPGAHPDGVLQIKAGRPNRHIRGTALLLGGFHNYYHHIIDYWINYFYMMQMIQRYQYGDIDFVRSALECPIICNEIKFPFQSEAVDLLGIPRDLLIPVAPAETLLVDRLILLPQMALGYGWMRDLAPRNWLIDLLKIYTTPLEPCSRIYISRREARNRRLINEGEFETLLLGLGFKTFILEQIPLKAQLKLFTSATLIVASHGAGLTNIIVAPSNAKIVELMPTDGIQPDYFSNLATSLGQQFFRFPVSGKFESGHDSYVELDKFLAFLSQNVIRDST